MVFYSIILLFLLCKINETCERDLGSVASIINDAYGTLSTILNELA